MAIRIITDSSSDYPISAARECAVEIIPMAIQFGTDTYWDGQALTSDIFYSMLTSHAQFPTTSQPTPDAFLQLFQRAKNAGDQVVVISLSGALSGTFQSAVIARELCDYGPIHIVDSRSATAGMQLLVNHACNLRDSGASAADIAREIELLKERVCIFAVIDTLEYLRRGGRLSAVQANLGTVTKLKPVITLRDGAVNVVNKAFGTAAAVKQLIKLLAEHPADNSFPIHLLYTDDRNRDALVLPKLADVGIPPEKLIYSAVGPTIGTHIGPGGLGLAYIKKQK